MSGNMKRASPMLNISNPDLIDDNAPGSYDSSVLSVM